MTSTTEPQDPEQPADAGALSSHERVPGSHESSQGLRAPIHPVKDRHHHRRPQPSIGVLARDLSICLRVLINAESARQRTSPNTERGEILGECEDTLARYLACYPDPYEGMPDVY